MPYLGSIPLCDLLGCGVGLAVQLAALLPVSKHLHQVGTKLGAPQVDSKEVTLLCNTRGKLSWVGIYDQEHVFYSQSVEIC